MDCDRRILATFAIASALAAAAAGAAEQKGAPDPDQVVPLVVALTNDFRAGQGRAPVRADPRLAEAARYFAGYLAKVGTLSHTADGSTPAARAKKHGYDFCIISENIASRYSSAGFGLHELAQGLVDGWEKSPGHRRNMLDPDVTDIGVAVAHSRKTGYYAVQVFGRPSSRNLRFGISNGTGSTIRYRMEGRAFALEPRQTRTHTQCRSTAVSFDLPGNRDDTTLRPGNGEQLVVVRSGAAGGYSITKEQMGTR